MSSRWFGGTRCPWCRGLFDEHPSKDIKSYPNEIIEAATDPRVTVANRGATRSEVVVARCDP